MASLLFADGAQLPWLGLALQAKHNGLRPCVQAFRLSTPRSRAAARRRRLAADPGQIMRTHDCVLRGSNLAMAPPALGAWQAAIEKELAAPPLVTAHGA